jgi:hypothetical protein
MLKHLYYIPTILATTLLLQPALADTTVTKISAIGNTPTYVDLDHDGDLDFFIKAADGTIEYHENIDDAHKPIKERNNAANLGVPIRTTRDFSNSLDILTVNENIYLSSKQSTANLFLTVNDPKLVKGAMVTIILPKSDDLTEEEREVMVELPNLSCKFSASIENVFNVPGPYQVHYFVTDNTDDILSFDGTSVVYKSQEGNQAPAAFNLFSPPDGATTQTTFEFKWEETTDPENDLVTYTLIIAQDPEFKNVVLQSEDIFASKTAIYDHTVLKDGTQGIADLSTYYWKVEAVDNFGNQTPSRHVYSFNTENTNAGFNLDDISGDGILGKSSIPDQLVVNVAGKRYLVTLPETSTNIFTVTSAVPIERTDKYEAFYNPVTKKVSIPNYGGMELIPDSDKLVFKKID